jgi:hypothetical protein
MEATGYTRTDVQDEISLIDLFLVLAKRKKLFLGVLGFCVVAATGLALLRNNTYLYSTSLEIGTFYQDKEQVFIDTPQTVLSKLEEGYIPAVLSAYHAENTEVSPIKITARLPKGSEIVVIESKGKESLGDTIKQLEGRVVDLIKADHARTIDVRRNALLVRQENLTRHQNELRDQEAMLRSDKERLQILKKLVTQQLDGVKVQVDDATASRKKARTAVSDEAKAMTLLMIDNEINQNRNRLAALEERLYVNIPNRSNELDKALADNNRAQESNKAEIASLGLVLKNFRETRAIIAPTKSMGPVGISKAVIAVLGMLLGGMLATFAVFFAEFLATARQRLAEKHTLSTKPFVTIEGGVPLASGDSTEKKSRPGALG